MNSIFHQMTFQEQATELKGYVVDYLVKHNHAHTERIIEALNNQGELLTATMEAVAAYLIEKTRKLNLEANELSRLTVQTDEGVDRLVANAGLKRAIYKPATDTEPAIMEDNESLLTRYDLSHYQANTTGTEYGYKFHTLCYLLDERPTMEIKREGNKTIQTFTFQTKEPIKSGIDDAEWRTPEPGSGRVCGAITPTKGMTPDLEGLKAYISRPDIKQATDIIETKLATRKPYSVEVIAYTNNDPLHFVNVATLRDMCELMASVKRKNGRRVSEYDYAHIAQSLGAYDVDVVGLESPVVCDWDEYPECEGMVIRVLDKR